MGGQHTAENNRIIRRSLLKMLTPCFLSALTVKIIYIIDSMIAGVLFTPTHIAALGVAGPIMTIVNAVISTVSVGVGHAMSVSLGRGNREEASRKYSLGILLTLLLGGISLLCCEFFAPQLVWLCGGRAAPRTSFCSTKRT